jgi:hypothetical protein
MITAETARQLFEGAAVAHWNVRACTVCGARAGFVFEAGQPPLLRGDHDRCSEPVPQRPTSWQAVADSVNALPQDMLDGLLMALEGVAAQNPGNTSPHFWVQQAA